MASRPFSFSLSVNQLVSSSLTRSLLLILFISSSLSILILSILLNPQLTLEGDVTKALEAAADNLKCLYTNMQSYELINKLWGTQMQQPGQRTQLTSSPHPAYLHLIVFHC